VYGVGVWLLTTELVSRLRFRVRFGLGSGTGGDVRAGANILHSEAVRIADVSSRHETLNVTSYRASLPLRRRFPRALSAHYSSVAAEANSIVIIRTYETISPSVSSGQRQRHPSLLQRPLVDTASIVSF